MQVVRLIDKYPKTGIGQYDFKYNPTRYVIYQNYDTREYGILEVPKFHGLDGKFGWEYQPTEHAHLLGDSKAIIPKGTVFFTPPSILEDGDYAPGLEVKTALMSLPAAIEDGFLVTEEFCQRLKTKGVKELTFSFGTSGFPLNIHGDKDVYKILPEIGERIEDDLLCVIREFDHDTALYDLTPKALRTPDFFFDRPFYIEPGARIIDITVRRQNRHPTVPGPWVEQLERYHSARRRYLEEAHRIYRRLKDQYGENLRLSPSFTDFLADAEAERDARFNGVRAAKVAYRNNNIDDWHVTVRYEHDIIPTIGYKMSDFSGGKGVIVDKIPEKDAPVDARGHRMEVGMDDKSTIKRMNLGRLYERYFYSAMDHLEEDLKVFFGFEPLQRKSLSYYLDNLPEDGDDKIMHAFGLLLKFYGILSPAQFEKTEFLFNVSPGYPRKHLAYAFSKGIYIYAPVDNPVDYAEAVKEVEELVKPLHAPVKYKTPAGITETTVDPVRIAPMYMMLLEKIPDDWAAVASAKRQHYGVLSKITAFDKYSTPERPQSTRITGEAEVRLMTAAMDPMVVADLVDRSSNPAAARIVNRSIMQSDTPSNIDHNIHREDHPLGYSKIQVFIHHLLECDGLGLYRDRLK